MSLQLSVADDPIVEPAEHGTAPLRPLGTGTVASFTTHLGTSWGGLRTPLCPTVETMP